MHASHGTTLTRRPVVVTSYQPHWVDEFTRIAKHIRDLVGPAAIRIDHIGSTAVPGLGAKDVIDIQITVSDLDRADGLTDALRTAGFRHGTTFEHDLFHRKSEIRSCASCTCGSRRVSDESIYISASAGGSTSGMRCCSATTFVQRKTFAPNTSS